VAVAWVEFRMMSRTFEQRGFTVLELMITVAVLTLALTIGVPSMLSAAEKRRTISATEQIYSQLQLARSASVARSEQVFANIVEGVDWAIGVSNDPTGDPSDNMPPCTLGDVVDGSNEITELVSVDDFDSVAIASSVAQITFSPQRATASAATIDVTSNGSMGYVMRVEVGILGQISMCSPDTDPATYVAGYRACT
jgi:type IV fimbrial biogenesis protein FimT